jgi:hypothetical protein
LASNRELFTSAESKNRECRDLQQELELKNAQLVSFEEARKRDEGENFFAFFLSVKFSMISPTSILAGAFFLCRIVKHRARYPQELH